jgi:alkylation response protein AidB-like acyl-CoA dehydrogenase
LAISAPVLSQLDDETITLEILPHVLDGSLVVTCAVFGPQQLRCTSGQVYPTISGEQRLILDADVCGGYLVFAAEADGNGLALAWVDGGATGIQVISTPGLDQLRPFATVTFRETPARILAGSDAGAELRRFARLRAAYAIGSEQAGVAQRCLDMAVEYAKHRQQFGQAIGAFQVIQHKCADMLVEVESARSAARYAASLLAADPAFRDSETAWAAWAAAIVGGRAAVRVAEDCIQIHGGIGYTWEHPAHRYLRRAKASQLLLGTPFDQLAVLGEMVGLWPAAGMAV